MTNIYVSIGSNIDPQPHIRDAIWELVRQYGKLDISSVYQSRAVGFSGDSFCNLVVRFPSNHKPERINRALKKIERAHGRIGHEKEMSSRTIDLDLLAYGSLVRHDTIVNVPRRDILLYDFVLRPLAEIAGDAEHPELKRTYAALWQKFNGKQMVLRKIEINLQQ